MGKFLIDAEKVIGDLTAMKTQLGVDAILIDGIIDGLKRQPKLDAVEVVRCKDCKHCCTVDTRKKGELSKLYYCRYNRHLMKDCDFCREGKRRMK